MQSIKGNGGVNLGGIKTDDKKKCLYSLKSYNQILMTNVASKFKWFIRYRSTLAYNEIWTKLQNAIAVDKNLKKNIDTTTERQALKTIENTVKMNCNLQKHKND